MNAMRGLGRRVFPGEDRRGRKSRGQVIIMYTLMLTTLLVLVGLGVDSAHVYWQKRNVRGAADLSALAGVIDLPDSSANAIAAARANATANGYTNGTNATTVGVTTPYGGSILKIEVVISRQVPTFFVRFLGLIAPGDQSTATVTGRAVATRETGAAGIFAMKPGCPNDPASLKWNGSSTTIEGSMHSNGSIDVSGSGNTVNGPTTYDCSIKKNGNTFNPAPVDSGPKPPPVNFTLADFTCTYGTLSGSSKFDIDSDGPWWVGGKYDVAKTLKDGVYCAGGDIVLGKQGVKGNTTFVSKRQIVLSGSNADLKPAPTGKGVLAYSAWNTKTTSDQGIKLEGSNSKWLGLLYAPESHVYMSGSSNASLTGSIVAWTIEMAGQSMAINVGEGGKGKILLIE